MSLGGIGVISVTANIIPDDTHDLCAKFFEGDIAGAAKLQRDTNELCNNLFSEVNPIPVKAALARMGKIQELLRLPLTPMEEPFRTRLYSELEALGLI